MKKYQDLLKLARETLENHFSGKTLVVSNEIKKKYSKNKACFITLTINDNLRGCIGSIYPRKELWKDVIENSLNAAFNDTRFEELTKEEIKKVKIELSVLSIPEKLEYKSIEDLKKKISGKGVILGKGYNSATYLPQVWEQISDKEEFLSSLCEKAGLPGMAWKDNFLDFWIYSVEKISE